MSRQISDLLQRQREIARVGKLRIGEKRVNQAGKEYPATRATWRATGASRTAMELIREAYGGTVRPWGEQPGQFEALTDTNQLSCIVDIKNSFSEQFSQYDGKTCTHRCDGIVCRYTKIERDRTKKVITVELPADVPCLCDPAFANAVLANRDRQAARSEDDFSDEDFMPEPLTDQERKCDVLSTLRVLLPCTNDLTLWEYQSKGAMFNSEVKAMLESMGDLGMRRAFIHLTMHQMSSTVGNEKRQWTVVRITLDSNPPDFIQVLLANTPEAQALKAVQQAAAQLGSGRPIAFPKGPDELPERSQAGQIPAADLPLPPGWAESREFARQSCFAHMEEKKWGDAKQFPTEKARLVQLGAQKGYYWPALYCCAVEAQQADSLAQVVAYVESWVPVEVVSAELVDPLGDGL